MTRAHQSHNRFYFVAGEASGDLLGAEVISAMREQGFDAPIRATGGAGLAAHADASSIDVSPLSVLGLWEGLKAYGDVKRIAAATADDIIRSDADHVVLIDSWGFCLRVAQSVRLTRPDIKLTKLIGPQIWATRAGRAKTLAAAVDHLLCIHEFEASYYKPYDLDVHAIGHPALSRADQYDRAAGRRGLGIDPETQLVLILPGSRMSEIEYVAPVLVQTAKMLIGSGPDRRVVVAPAQNVRSGFLSNFPDLPSTWEILDADEDRFSAMAAADIALACSGTVTTEIAAQGTPLITGYRTGRITGFLVRHLLMRADYITLLNMAAGEMVVPEYVQGAFTPARLAPVAEALLASKVKRANQVAAQDAALAKMRAGGRSAQMLAAQILLSLS